LIEWRVVGMVDVASSMGRKAWPPPSKGGDFSSVSYDNLKIVYAREASLLG